MFDSNLIARKNTANLRRGLRSGWQADGRVFDPSAGAVRFWQHGLAASGSRLQIVG